MLLDIFATGPFQANCVLLGDRQAGLLAVFDPGDEAERIAERIKATGLQPSLILLTHGHIDHAGATAPLKRLLGDAAQIGLHRDELEVYKNMSMQGMLFGMQIEAPPEPDLWLEHGQQLTLGSLRLEIRHAPGHSPGSVCFVVHGAPDRLAISGDLLLSGTTGRTDLWGGSWQLLEQSIREQVYTLPGETRLITGHGPSSTVAYERQFNMLVKG